MSELDQVTEWVKELDKEFAALAKRVTTLEEWRSAMTTQEVGEPSPPLTQIAHNQGSIETLEDRFERVLALTERTANAAASNTLAISENTRAIRHNTEAIKMQNKQFWIGLGGFIAVALIVGIVWILSAGI